MHIMDIAQNSITAGAKTIRVEVEEDTAANVFLIRVEDDGCGMSPREVEKATDPYYTSRTTRKVGLGIPLFRQHAEQAGGYLQIRSSRGKGTAVEAMFRHDHIDRQELGDMGGVVTLLMGGNPEIRFCYRHVRDKKEFLIDTREIGEAIEGVPLSEPGVIRYVREMIREQLKEIQAI